MECSALVESHGHQRGQLNFVVKDGRTRMSTVCSGPKKPSQGCGVRQRVLRTPDS